MNAKSTDPGALLDLSLTYLDKAIALSPHEGEAYYYKARVRRAISNMDSEGLNVLNDFKMATKGGYESQLNLARYYYDLGQYENAEKAATEAIKANRKFYEPYLVLLPTLVKLKKWTAIKSAEEEITKSWPGNPMIMTTLAGSMAFAPGEASRAAHVCDAVLKSNPTFLPALITRNTINQKPMSVTELQTDIRFPYSATKYVGKTLLSVTVDGSIYLADMSGKVMSPFPYTPVATLGQDFMVVKNEQSKFGVTNLQGDTLISVQYDKIEPSGDYVIVTKGRLVGLYTPQMKRLMDVKHQSIQVNEDAIFYQLQDRWGAADLTGRTIVRPTYTKVSFDKHNLQRVIKAENKTVTHYYNFTGRCLNCK